MWQHSPAFKLATPSGDAVCTVNLDVSSSKYAMDVMG